MQNWLLDEMMIEQRIASLEHSRDLAQRVRLAELDGHAGLRSALASGLVRLGMLVDRAAGERAVAPAMRHEGGRA